MDPNLLIAFLAGIGCLLGMILWLRINAFIALLVASIVVGLVSGMDPSMIVTTIQKGMGGTLGFVATVVGLGAIFGEILRYSGSTEKMANKILSSFGENRSSTALSLIGFLIAIPVFFDVAFIIIVPIIYALQKRTGKSLLYFAIPLLASLAVTHAFIPPTPGPIAVADILNADLGQIIFFGFIVGIPTTIVAGLIFGKYISGKIHLEIPKGVTFDEEERPEKEPKLWIVFSLIALPIVLILLNTASKAMYPVSTDPWLKVVQFLGHPFTALILSTLLAIYFLGVNLGASKEQLQKVSMRALGPAGVIILITGAGGVFKQMLIESGAGKMLAEQFASLHITPVLMAFALALIVRLIQGSATVAMITAAGIMAPILLEFDLSPSGLALIVLSIAAGASGFSHVNDSGFWLVNRYLGMDEKQTLQSWTAMTGILALTALSVILILDLFI